MTVTSASRPTNLAFGHPSVVGYCTTEAAEKALSNAGAVRIWRLGNGGETLEWALNWLRGRPGTLAVAEDLRCLGKSRKDIFSKVRELEAAGITIADVRSPAANSLTLLERALISMNAGAEQVCRKTRQRRGKKGGELKGIQAAARRSALIDDEIAERICSHPSLTWKDRCAILGMPRTSLIRHYT